MNELEIKKIKKMNKYDNLWQHPHTTCPTIDALQGKWRVRVVSGWLSPLYWLLLRWNHYINIWGGEKRIGNNKVFGYIFGKFYIGEIYSQYDEGYHYRYFSYLNHNDYIKQINESKMLGQMWDSNKMIGYFTMERKENERT